MKQVCLLLCSFLLLISLSSCLSSRALSEKVQTTADPIDTPAEETKEPTTDSNILDNIKKLNTSMCGSDVFEILGEDYRLLHYRYTESILMYSLPDNTLLFVMLGWDSSMLSSQPLHATAISDQCLAAIYWSGQRLQTDENGYFAFPAV